MKKLIFALAVVVLALAAGRSEASACSTSWNTCINHCRAGGALCHGSGLVGGDLCDSSESICEDQCTSTFLDCANGGLPAN